MLMLCRLLGWSRNMGCSPVAVPPSRNTARTCRSKLWQGLACARKVVVRRAAAQVELALRVELRA